MYPPLQVPWANVEAQVLWGRPAQELQLMGKTSGYKTSEAIRALPFQGSVWIGFLWDSRFIMFSTQTKLIYYRRISLLLWNDPSLDVGVLPLSGQVEGSSLRAGGAGTEGELLVVVSHQPHGYRREILFSGYLIQGRQCLCSSGE